MTSQKCRYSPATLSRSNPDATWAQWIMWSQLMNLRLSRSRSKLWIGLEKSWTFSTTGTRRQVRCHHPLGPTGSPPNSGSPLGFHFSSGHDRSGHLHFCHGFLHLETLLSSQRNSNTNTFGTTDVDVSHHSTTSSHNKGCTRTCPETNQQHLSCTKQQRYPHQHHHHLGDIKTHQERTLKKGRDIRNDIFVNLVNT